MDVGYGGTDVFKIFNLFFIFFLQQPSTISCRIILLPIQKEYHLCTPTAHLIFTHREPHRPGNKKPFRRVLEARLGQDCLGLEKTRALRAGGKALEAAAAQEPQETPRERERSLLSSFVFFAALCRIFRAAQRDADAAPLNRDPAAKNVWRLKFPHPAGRPKGPGRNPLPESFLCLLSLSFFFEREKERGSVLFFIPTFPGRTGGRVQVAPPAEGPPENKTSVHKYTCALPRVFFRILAGPAALFSRLLLLLLPDR